MLGLGLMLSNFILFAQSVNDVFNKDVPVIWMGLDFTGVIFIGDRDKFGSTSDLRYLMETWNDLMDREKDKYNVAKATRRKKVEFALDVTKDFNTGIDPVGLFSEKSADYFHLNPPDVEEIIRNYDFKNYSSGIGLMFVVESFNKLNEQASIYVTFINLSDRSVLFTERLTGNPGGMGLRNYWAGAIRNVMEKMGGKEFERWRKKYYR